MPRIISHKSVLRTHGGLELLTASQLHLAVMVLVLRDRELAQIAQFQQIALGRKSCSELPDYDLADICRGAHVEYLSLTRKADARSDAWKGSRDHALW